MNPNKDFVQHDEEDLDGLPPIFKNWNQMYAFVLGELFVLIALFYLFSKIFE